MGLPTAKPAKLTVPAGTTDGTAFDIDEDGTILGTVTSSSIRAKGEQTGYLWLPDGTARADAAAGRRRGPGRPLLAGVDPQRLGGRPVGHRLVRRVPQVRVVPLPGRHEQLRAAPGRGRDAGPGGGERLGAGHRGRAPDHSGGGVTKLPRYRKGTEYQMASYSDDGLIAGGHMTGVGTIENQPLMWRCRLTR